MRDILILAFTVASVVMAWRKPWIGVLALAVFAYLNPHRYAWGFSTTMPVYFVVFIATVLGMVTNAEDREPFPWTRETTLFFLLIACFTLSTLISPDEPTAAREQWVKVMKIYLGIFPTFWLINSREKLRWLLVTISISFGLIGLKGGIWAFTTGFHFRVSGPPDTFYAGNNEIALALNMVLPFLLVCAKETENLLAKKFFYATFFFSICAIISSWSRGGLLALCAVLPLIVLTGKRKWLSIPIVALALMFAVPNLPEEWFARMHTIETYESDESMQGRFSAWNYNFERALRNPLTGGGFETWMEHGVDAHSAYFEVMGEHGFIALGLWLTLLFGTMAGLELLRRQSILRDDLAWMALYARAIQISLVGYMVGGALLGVAYWDIFYHLIAVYVVMKVMYLKQTQEEEDARNIVYTRRTQAAVWAESALGRVGGET